MKIKISKSFLNVVTQGTAHAMAIYPFIILRSIHLKDDKTLINHEKIHLRQQLELLIVPFYLLYFIEYLVRRIQYSSHHEAYCNISFEREAYFNQVNENYLDERKYGAFFNYFKKK